jgi:hypothetical protein
MIPLVGHNLELLPVHFAVDPGPDFDWSQTHVRTGDPQSSLSPPIQQQPEVETIDSVELLRRYIDIRPVVVGGPKQSEEGSVPATGNAASSVAVAENDNKPAQSENGNGKRHERVLQRNHSSASGFEDSSAGSDDGAEMVNGSGSSSSSSGKGAGDDHNNSSNNKKRGVARGLQGVIRTVGNLGMNVSKTLKKWAAGGGSLSGRARKRSVGTETQCTLATLAAVERLLPGSEVRVNQNRFRLAVFELNPVAGN